MDIGFNSMNTPLDPPPHELARALEERGFESLWYGEHSHIPCALRTPYPAGGDLPKHYWHMMDPFVSLTAAACATTKLKLATGVCLVVERDPIMLAKEIATLDHLSGGRFLFGIGAGWNAEEMENHGTDFKTRFKLMRQRVQAMKTIWTEEEPSFHSEFVNFEPLWSYPKPARKPHPPVILGTFASAWGRRRVAEFGDGWIPIDRFHGDLATDIADLHQRLRDKGRDPASVPISMFDIFETSEDDLKRFADLGAIERAIPRCPTADKDTVLRWLDKYAAIGRRIGAM